MIELVILRGLPGCGKSTAAALWVAEDPLRRAEVNRDYLRQMMHRGFFAGADTELQIRAVRDSAISVLLNRGVSVISSDTNLPRRTVRDLVKLGRKAGADVSLIDMTDVPLGVCLKQNEKRSDKAPVPEQVIRDYHAKYVRGASWPMELPEEEGYSGGGIVPYESDETLPPAIIVDIDGTVALKGARSPFDETRVHEDRPNWPVIKVVCNLLDDGNRLIFLSGRTDGCRDATIDWLRDHVEGDTDQFELHMRKAGDMRKDWIVKSELFDEHVRGKYNILCVFDDRDQVVRLWRDMGLTCLQVAEGNF